MGPTLTADELRLVDELDRLCDGARAAMPGEPVPCFAHLRLETAGRVRDLLLGFRTVAEGPVTVLHWQTAPLASVFFSASEGEGYELEVAGRTLEGTVLARHLLDFDRGTLVEVTTARAVLSRRDGGPWRRVGDAPAPLLSPRPTGAARAPSPFTLEALDPAQRRAVELPAARPLLVLGEAGCGKTTVALHRLAALCRRAEQEKRPFRALVLVPMEGLRRLSETILARLGASQVEVRAFDRWAAVQARRAFPGIPRRESRDTPPAVARLKRHPALREAMAQLVREPARRRGGGGGRGASRSARRAAAATREDLLHLFGDRLLMERVAAASGGAINAHAVRQVLEHTRVQFTETTEEENAHVDADRLETVDGLRIDAGTALEDAGGIDVEDYAVLFALAARRAGKGAPAPASYDAVVLDEAQEFAPLELELVGRALAPGGTLIVAGDEGQQVDPTAHFVGWDGAMRELGAPAFATARLAVSYRCPPAVTALARAVLRPEQAAPADPADDAVVRRWAPNECHLVAHVVDGLRALRLRDPGASVAVVYRTPEAAARGATLLGRGEPVRLVRGGDFRFAPGVEVTCVQEVKGLEFDHVVVPDAEPGAYPDEGAARRALYVAATRASHQLALAAAARWSPVVPGAAVTAPKAPASRRRA